MVAFAVADLAKSIVSSLEVTTEAPTAGAWEMVRVGLANGRAGRRAGSGQLWVAV